MGFLDRLLGRPPATQGGYAESSPQGRAAGGSTAARGSSEDDRAIARYRYLLRTAPPESLERVHAEAFAQLTPDQREQVLAELSSGLPPGEAAPTSDPQSLARAATRAELRQPGYLESTFSRGRFGGGGAGMGMGGTIMGSMLGTMAGFVIGSAIADALFDDYGSSPEAAQAGESGESGEVTDGSPEGDATAAGDAGAESGDTGVDSGYDSGGYDSGGGGGWDSGGFGGGDFGGGDMGGF
jgi:hypothetical protein